LKGNDFGFRFGFFFFFFFFFVAESSAQELDSSNTIKLNLSPVVSIVATLHLQAHECYVLVTLRLATCCTNAPRSLPRHSSVQQTTKELRTNKFSYFFFFFLFLIVFLQINQIRIQIQKMNSFSCPVCSLSFDDDAVLEVHVHEHFASESTLRSTEANSTKYRFKFISPNPLSPFPNAT
jgi:hypothetical protein